MWNQLPRLTGGAPRALWRQAWNLNPASSKHLRLPLVLGHRVQRGTSHSTLEELWGPQGQTGCPKVMLPKVGVTLEVKDGPRLWRDPGAQKSLASRTFQM